MSKLSITSKGVRTRVELDGQDISPVLTGALLRYGVGEAPSAVLDVLLIHESDVGADGVDVVIPDETARILVRLGWTPPAQPATSLDKDPS